MIDEKKKKSSPSLMAESSLKKVKNSSHAWYSPVLEDPQSRSPGISESCDLDFLSKKAKI